MISGKRKHEFLRYHKYGDGDCNGQVLKAYAARENLDLQECYDLAYFYSVCYCCASTVYLFEHRETIKENPVAFAAVAKKILIFETDRRWVAFKDRLEKILLEYSAGKSVAGFLKAVCENDLINEKSAVEYVENWYYFNRYSAYLFVETFCDITGKKSIPNYDNDLGNDRMVFLSGLFRYYGYDETAEGIHRGYKNIIGNASIETLIHQLIEDVSTSGGDPSFVKIETSLCAYEKMFRGTRYNGYYADRMLEEITKMSAIPQTKAACDKILMARAEAIQNCYLGEYHGWTGIRRNLKTYYRENDNINFPLV